MLERQTFGSSESVFVHRLTTSYINCHGVVELLRRDEGEVMGCCCYDLVLTLSSGPDRTSNRRLKNRSSLVGRYHLRDNRANAEPIPIAAISH